jgi:hypothetical protein
MMEFFREYGQGIIVALMISYLAAQATGYIFDKVFPKKEGD